jgi:hypothetical protein
MWLGETPPAFGLLGNAVRTRFVTYSDPRDPDRMIGYIQPYFFPFAAGGLVIVKRPILRDPLNGNHIPTIDPLTSPLPSGCDVSKGCLATASAAAGARRGSSPSIVRVIHIGNWSSGSALSQQPQYLLLLDSRLWQARTTTTRVLACKEQWR